jgi:hypothetical protein
MNNSDFKDIAIDITDDVALGTCDSLIEILKKWKDLGYNQIYFDGYDAAIYLYKEEDVKI